MRSVGIDVASAGFSSIALVVNGVPNRSVLWKPKDKRDSVSVRIDDYYTWICRWLRMFKPNVISVEELAVFMNKPTIRALARHEGVALLAAARLDGAIVLNPGISQARGVVFGNGKLSKDDAWVFFKKMYPEVELRGKNSGGTDQVDAYTHALAAPTILERR
jgi:Holliday junction resolvasome RuvABC endonuclease subunit